MAQKWQSDGGEENVDEEMERGKKKGNKKQQIEEIQSGGDSESDGEIRKDQYEDVWSAIQHL